MSEFLNLQLQRYLYFTINLELLVVNPNLLRLAKQSRTLNLTDDENLAIHKMYIDEGFHALFCVDLVQQVEVMTNIKPKFKSEPSFMRKLKLMNNMANDEFISGILFTCVAETLITSNLTDVTRQGDTPISVRHVMQDHAQDEARHHAFFKAFIRKIYRENPLSLRNVLHLVPYSIMAFIEPDREHLRLGMMQVGVSRADAEQIIADTYPT